MPKPLLVRSVIAVSMMLGASVVSLRAQSTMVTTTETDLTKDPAGVSLVHLAKGVSVATGAARDGSVQATVQGWITADALHDDTRGGFDVSVATPGGVPLHASPGGGSALGTARFGALFDRLDTRGAWVHVRRTGWVAAAAIAAKSVAPPTENPSRAVVGANDHSPQRPSRAVVAGANDHSPQHPSTTISPSQRTPPPSATIPTSGAAPPSSATILAGSSLALQPDGAPFANIETPVAGTVMEHQGGWTRLRIDVWVPDAALGNAVTPGGITAADLRAAPDKYVGQNVDWTVEFLGVETADELRPEMPAGQPYLLTRGPLPEAGFVYVMIPKDSVDAFQRLDPLTKLRIRATIRAGKSRFLPTPIVELVRRLN